MGGAARNRREDGRRSARRRMVRRLVGLKKIVRTGTEVGNSAESILHVMGSYERRHKYLTSKILSIIIST
jgi:hypothetical protein